MGKVLSINISPVKGIEKTSIKEVRVIKDWGLEGDAHAGDWDRQVSIFPIEAMAKVPPEKKEEVEKGGFTENITISGVELSQLAVGNFVQIGECIVKINCIGKEEFKEKGRPYIVSREGRFGRVIRGGLVKVGDPVRVIPFSKDSFLEYVKDGNREMVQAFLEGGINPDSSDMYGATALMLAARKGHPGVVKALLEKGADVNAKSDDYVTALMVAAHEGHTGIVEMLLAAGADCNISSSGGLTALILARSNNHAEVARILEMAGAL